MKHFYKNASKNILIIRDYTKYIPNILTLFDLCIIFNPF